ncbi:Uncharacterised protein [Mycobacteroides abscessus subsp. massiliense]|nr:Uncharacterised protein [Mycobacteroides abscessus subsp. massiliense]
MRRAALIPASLPPIAMTCRGLMSAGLLERMGWRAEPEVEVRRRCLPLSVCDGGELAVQLLDAPGDVVAD